VNSAAKPGPRVDNGGEKGPDVVARFDVYTFDSARRQVTTDGGGEVHLTPKAFDLLALLISEAPRVVTKDDLHRRLWPDAFVSDATLVGLIKELRHTLPPRDGDVPIIRTSHGIGYAFSGHLLAAVPGQEYTTRWGPGPIRHIQRESHSSSRIRMFSAARHGSVRPVSASSSWWASLSRSRVEPREMPRSAVDSVSILNRRTLNDLRPQPTRRQLVIKAR